LLSTHDTSGKDEANGKGEDQLRISPTFSCSPMAEEALADSSKAHISVVAFNTDGINKDDGLEHFLEEMKLFERPWDAILVQEGPYSENKEILEVDGGHVWCVGPCRTRPRSVAILIHRRWAKNLKRFESPDDRICYADVTIHNRVWRLVSAHLPHSIYPDTGYFATLSALEDVLPINRRTHSSIIGCDANAVVGKQTDFDKNTIVGKHGMGTRTARGDMFASWAHTNLLSITNTMFQKSEGHVWTHRMRGSGLLRQIDFILVDELLYGSVNDSFARHCWGIETDHRLVWCKVGAKPPTRKRWRQPATNRGWKLEPSKEHYRSELKTAHFSGKMSQLHCFDEDLALIASQHGSSSGLGPCKINPLKQSREIEELRVAKKRAKDVAEQRDISKKLQRALRRYRRQRYEEQLDELIAYGKASNLKSLKAKPLTK